jgi:2-methylcitrate dehydratase PrpD
VVEVTNPKGHDRNAMTLDDVAVKFRGLVEPALGAAATATALEQWTTIRRARALTPAMDVLQAAT